MSHNTNTLFWIITGAVVVLGIFLLISTQGDTGSRIAGKFNSLWTGEEYDGEDYSSYFNDDVDSNFHRYVQSCGSNLTNIDGYRIEVHDYYDNEAGGSYIRWIITNKNDTISNKYLYLYFYDCASNNEILSAGWPLDTVPANQTIRLTTWGGSLFGDFSYYIKAEVR